MARPKLGLFGALMAVGGLLALRYVQQRNRAMQVQPARELSRWEGEGGAVATPSASVAPTTPHGTTGANGTNGTNGTNGASHPNGNGVAWPYPRS
jgi:hypothetical protein